MNIATPGPRWAWIARKRGMTLGQDQDRDAAEPRGETRPQIDDNAWRDAVVQLIPALRAFAWSLCRNGSDADDLVQESLTKAWTHRSRFEAGTNLRAWLFTILRNTHYTNAVKRRREVQDEDGSHAATLISFPSQDWNLALQGLQKALQSLPTEHREALILVGAAGLSYEEAAAICGCAVGTIKSRVNRARNRLARLMDPEPVGGGGGVGARGQA